MIVDALNAIEQDKFEQGDILSTSQNPPAVDVVDFVELMRAN